MPKRKGDFGEKVSTNVSVDTMADLLSISFQSGNGKQYGPILRLLLADAIRLYKGSMDDNDKKRKDFEDIRKNVLIVLLKREPTKREVKGKDAVGEDIVEPSVDVPHEAEGVIEPTEVTLEAEDASL